MLALKSCRTCKEVKPLTDFHRKQGTRDGYRSDCKSCRQKDHQKHREVRNEISKLNYQKNFSSYRDKKLLKKFNLTSERFAEILASQDGVCALCGKPEVATRQGIIISLAVDHDHTCCPGEITCGACIRGLLCNGCNIGLGAFRDDIDTLQKAIEYLKRGPLNASS